MFRNYIAFCAELVANYYVLALVADRMTTDRSKEGRDEKTRTIINPRERMRTEAGGEVETEGASTKTAAAAMTEIAEVEALTESVEVTTKIVGEVVVEEVLTETAVAEEVMTKTALVIIGSEVAAMTELVALIAEAEVIVAVVAALLSEVRHKGKGRDLVFSSNLGQFHSRTPKLNQR